MAVKKPAKKAAKAAKKTSKPAARKVAVKKPVAKKTAVKKPGAKKAAAKKPVAKKVAAKKLAPVKKAVARKLPVKAAAKKPAPAKKPVAPARQPAKTVKPAAPVKKPAPAPAVKTAPAKPVAKSAGKPATRTSVDPKPNAAGVKTALAANPASPVTVPRPIGKVAVAVIARPSAPAPKAKVKVVPYKNDLATGRPIVPDGYKPSADEEYMGSLQIEYFRQRLVSWRADLVEESKQTIENLKDEVRDVGDEAERATRETENSLELRTRDRYRKLIGKIDSTLKRLDVGEYGYSVDSGEEIGLERLEARLTAERTIDEQERWEHLQKQIGD
ncbi:MAG: RNA polymerase-binding protein DksA [Luteimonas sp.]